MVLRLRTHLIVNPLLFENLRHYLFATKVAHSASGIIEKLFGGCRWTIMSSRIWCRRLT